MEYKGYDLSVDNTGLIMVKPLGRGSSPKTLRGKYTSYKWAKGAVDAYLSSKEKSNGKAEVSG